MAIEENLRKIQEARYGREVRDAIHDAIHECYEDGRAGATDLIAREQIAAERTARETAVAGAMSAITAEQAARTAAVTAEENARTAAVAAEQAAREAAVANLESIKADKTQLASPFNFKGSCLFAELPTSGNEVNDTYYVTDMTSRYSWNGTAWYQSGMSEADYTDALAAVETAVQNLEDGAPGTITGELKEDIAQVSDGVSKFNSIILSSAVIELDHNGKFIQNNQNVGDFCDTSALIDNANYGCVVIRNVPKGIKFNLTGSTSGAERGRLWAWIDSKGKMIDKAPANTAWANNHIIESPDNGCTLVANFYLNREYGIYVKDLYPLLDAKADIDVIENNINSISNSLSVAVSGSIEIVKNNMFVQNNQDVGSACDYTKPESYNGYGYVIIKNVPKDTEYIVNSQGGNRARPWAWLDENGIMIDKCGTQTAIAAHIFAPVDNAILVCNFNLETSVVSYLKTTYSIKENHDRISELNDIVNSINGKNWMEKANVCKYVRNNNNIETASLKFAFLSDIHRVIDKMSKIMDLCKKWGGDYIDTVVNAGDIVSAVNSDGYDWYFNLTSDFPVLNAVGNHDAWELEVPGDWSTIVKIDKKTVYDTLIAPTIANNTGIVQPTNASANGYNYYYKDFNSAVRVVILDCMYWDATQKAWFTNILNDAKSKNLHVVCVSHAIFPEDELVYIESDWNCKLKPYRDTTKTPIECAEVVSDFISNGGVFVGWFCGHTHSDEFLKLKNYDKQYMFATASSRQDGFSNTPKGSGSNMYNYFVLNYVVVDTANKLVKIQRIGADIDATGLQRDALTFSYS